ncbi:hypothetical protein HGM15179_016786 [Zosterops borbonicus]|uniref:Murine leukemia virus integrase C-terminal domain-containing protein n=1 Tax=Zosterops borbonicus TaxID=364589 RepID=A0A8K1G224_9PASS|nr:hypothetical protein HGM15179_016786 [Zosterops borbonicus]
MLKYQVALLEQYNVEFKVTTTLNPAMFLQASEEAQRPLYHDCLATIEQVCSGRPYLKSDPIHDLELDLYTGGSSMVQNGRWAAGYAVGISTQTVKVCHMDDHVPKNWANEEHQNNEQKQWSKRRPFELSWNAAGSNQQPPSEWDASQSQQILRFAILGGLLKHDVSWANILTFQGQILHPSGDEKGSEATVLAPPDETSGTLGNFSELSYILLEGLLPEPFRSFPRQSGRLCESQDPTQKQKTIEEAYSSRPNLKDVPLENPDWELYTDGSCFMRDVKELVKVLLNHIIPRFGIPLGLSSDRGPHFVATVVGEVSRILRIAWDLHRPTDLRSSREGLDTPAHLFQPGDWVYVKWWDSDPLQVKWRGPFRVLLTTLTAVKVAGKGPWIHYSRVKKASASEITGKTETDTIDDMV